MKELEQKIKQEIIELHKFFVDWFTGKLDKADLEHKLVVRFNKQTTFITTKGQSVDYNGLMQMFEVGYGKMKKDFKIAISDVEIKHEVGDYVLATYIEWQTDDPNPEANNSYTARKTTTLISKQTPHKWLHIHETMLPKPRKIIEQWRI